LNKQEEEDYEIEEKSYDDKEMICENDEISIEYKRRIVEFWKLDITMKPKSFNTVNFEKYITSLY